MTKNPADLGAEDALDYDDWAQRPAWSLIEAASLTVGRNPPTDADTDEFEAAGGPAAAVYSRLREATSVGPTDSLFLPSVQSFPGGVYRRMVRPEAFALWLSTRTGFEVPPLLAAALQRKSAKQSPDNRLPLEDAAWLIAHQAGKRYEDVLQDVCASIERGRDLSIGGLPAYEPGALGEYVVPSHLNQVPIWRLEAYLSDLNEWISHRFPRLEFRFGALESSPDADNGSPDVRPVPRADAQEAAILSFLRRENIDPHCLPPYGPGRPGAKARAWEALQKDRRMWRSQRVFKKAWERLRSQGELRDGPTE